MTEGKRKPGRPKRCPYIGPEYADLRARFGLSVEQTLQIWEQRREVATRLGFRKYGGGSYPHCLKRCGIDNPFSTHEAWLLMLKFALEPVQLEVNRANRERQRRERKAIEAEKAFYERWNRRAVA